MIRLLVLLAVLAGCTRPELLDVIAPDPAGVTPVKNLPYGERPRQAFDLYVPQGEGPHPVLVFFHGGGWKSGDRRNYAFAGQRFAKEGYLTAVPSYRLVPEGAYPVFMQDAAAALAAVAAQAPGHGGDPERLFLAGHSAGAYIAVQLSLAPEFLAAEGLSPDVIDGVAGLSGPYDFLPLDSGSAQAAFGTAPDLPATQPVNRVSAEAPPMLLITGGADDVVRPRNTRALETALRQAGVPVETVIYEGVGHGGPLVAVGLPYRLPVVERVVRFFAEQETGS